MRGYLENYDAEIREMLDCGLSIRHIAEWITYDRQFVKGLDVCETFPQTVYDYIKRKGISAKESIGICSCKECSNFGVLKPNDESFKGSVYYCRQEERMLNTRNSRLPSWCPRTNKIPPKYEIKEIY